jgi:hypothetical protein
LVFFVHELTARIKSPSDNFGRGFRINLFFFIDVVLTAAPVPPFNVSNSSTLKAGVVAELLTSPVMEIEHLCLINLQSF